MALKLNKRQVSVWISDEAAQALERLQEESAATQGAVIEAALLSQLGRTVTGADVVAGLKYAADLVTKGLGAPIAPPSEPASPPVRVDTPPPPKPAPVEARARSDPGANYGQAPQKPSHS
jgi:hypothetical protein